MEILVNHYKDPYETTNVSWKEDEFFRGSPGKRWMCVWKGAKDS